MNAIGALTRWDLCNMALHEGKGRFLEIGVGSGRAGRVIRARDKTGVDPVLRGEFSDYTTLYAMRSDEFFANVIAHDPPMYDAILIDGDHEYRQALRDIAHSLEHLTPDGAIVVHDCNPLDEVSQRVPRAAGQVHWNGDVWKAIVLLRATRPDLSVLTLDADEGLGFIRFAHGPEPLIEIPRELTWDGLVANRREWLGLVDTW